MKEQLKEAKQFAKQIGFDKVTHLGTWKEYECYNVDSSKGGEYGYPIYLLFDKDNRMRAAKDDEIFHIMRYFDNDE